MAPWAPPQRQGPTVVGHLINSCRIKSFTLRTGQRNESNLGCTLLAFAARRSHRPTHGQTAAREAGARLAAHASCPGRHRSINIVGQARVRDHIRSGLCLCLLLVRLVAARGRKVQRRDVAGLLCCRHPSFHWPTKNRTGLWVSCLDTCKVTLPADHRILPLLSRQCLEQEKGMSYK